MRKYSTLGFAVYMLIILSDCYKIPNPYLISDVSRTLNQCSTPVSSHCQSISESFIEDTLNENDPADDLMSFFDGASQDDDAGEVSKQCINVLDNQDVEKQTGKL
jgi:hypothetical protein